MNNIAVVIPTYNRPKALERLLFSLDNAVYKALPVLIISIDGGADERVVKVAEAFNWKGEKKIIKQQSNLGLKNHILSCGDLTATYDDVIILEDDLFVSRYYYDYTIQALHFYKNSPRVAGISLYQYQYNEYEDLPFSPLVDGYDSYFIQNASSWGQAWSKQQWEQFKNWYLKNDIWDPKDERLPSAVLSWPETSWKKFFIKYLIVTEQYFVYPRISLSTNFGDPGTNNGYKNNLHQVNLLIGEKQWQFANLNEGICYDAFFEIEGLHKFNKQNVLNQKDISFDLLPIELNVTEGLATADQLKAHIVDLKNRDDYKLKVLNLSYITITYIQNRLPSLITQLKHQIVYKLKKIFSLS
jgi:glycosyltransferase involved in cell wall biosynthesis